MSLKSIAQHLGLSTSTVSRALNGDPDVSSDTRQRVLSAAKASGYTPNQNARRLKRGKSDIVGLVYPFQHNLIENVGFIQNTASISAVLAQENIDVFLISDAFFDQRLSFVRLIESRSVDALIVAHTQTYDPRLIYLQEIGFPFLALGRSQLPGRYAWFDFDNEAGTMIATQAALAAGHRRIAYLGGACQLNFIRQRLHGFQRAMRQAGQTINPDWLFDIPLTSYAGYQATRAMFSADVAPTAIVTDDRFTGEGVAIALQELGYRPQDIALYVYDGLPEDTTTTFEVIPIEQSTGDKVGEQIGRMTLSLLAGTPPEQLQVLWQPALGRLSTPFPPADIGDGGLTCR
ncbi:LacI family DNA-binding transcriptional regulator [Affinibrenneria salicis]|uniref:LacI family DNA-binding transcriptional regulator n=1 Tax=Affinibrenneria salicis TaxID=2590031 RepID=A0A5J5FZC1_9GAMM|nr:LacI family DNA-binding transcriptional regulator [Affinibrenneria salicis]KAA8999385.1 LacI family DNA-binding transcriptional regulator [Affinibrenneria salicis]